MPPVPRSFLIYEFFNKRKAVFNSMSYLLLCLKDSLTCSATSGIHGLRPPPKKNRIKTGGGVLVALELKIALFLTLGWVGGVGKVDTQSL